MKIIKHGSEAREALKRGIDLVAKSAKPTLGPAGKVAVLGKLGRNYAPRIVDDAVSIAMECEASDPIENEAVKLVQEGLMHTSKDVHDSTATTLTLIEALTSAAFDKIKDSGSLAVRKVNTIELKKELDELCEEVVARLKKKARPITVKEIKHVALTAGTYEWIADLVVEVFSKIGKDGYVNIEEGVRTDYEVLSGLEIPAGYHSDYFVNSGNKECVLDLPYVLVTNQRLDDWCAPMFGSLIGSILEVKGKSLVVVAPEFSKNVLTAFTKTKLNDDFNIVALKLPTFDKDDILVDLATLASGLFFDKNTYTDVPQFMADVSFKGLGAVQKAVITDSKAVFIGGRGDVKPRIKRLKAQIKETQSAFDKDALEKRLASLSGGIATITIGGYSDSELGYFKLKLENAVASVENALKEGVVPGGGVALREVAEDMPKNFITEALKAPYKQIQENNGSPLEISPNVLDAVKNTIGALESARSFTGNVLMAETVIAYEEDESED